MRNCLLLSVLMVSMSMLPIITALDGDGDGVDDSLDICPFASGTANSTAGLGCPDSDGDGVANFEQALMFNWSDSNTLELDTTMGGEKTAVAWAPNNSVFYAGSKNNQVAMFDKSGNYMSLIHTMQGDVYDIEISPNGENLIVASDNGGCKIINATNGQMVADLWQGRTNNGVFEVAWSNDNTRVFCGGFDAMLSSYYTSNWSIETNYSGLPGWISGIDTTPDGRLVFVASNREVSAFWTSNGTQYTAHANHTQYIRVLTISPDGRYVATGGQDNRVIVMDIESETIIKEFSLDVHIYDIDFSSDGGSMVIARGFNSSSFVYRTDTWDSIGEIDLTTNWAPGLFAAEFDGEGERLVLAWRRGWISVIMVSEAFIRVEGDHYTSLMESSWRETFPTVDQEVGYWESSRVMTTIDLCDSGYPIGSSPNGLSPVYATKAANYSTTGLWDCINSNGQIIEIPYGRAAGALMVKAGGVTEACIRAVGGLSMAQLRWITSSFGESTLTSNGEMQALVWDSVVPNDDEDGIPEWKDLHSSCDNDEIVLSHRWENKSDLSIIEETVLCSNCANSDTLYSSTAARMRLDLGEYRSNVINGTNAPAGDGTLGFTELVYSLENSDGIYIVPMVDNHTHGAADAIAAGGVLVNASIEASRSGDWPLQTDMRAFTSVDHIIRNHDFMKYLLSEPGQIAWEDMGFTGLSLWERYLAYAKLGEDMYSILPDNDSDGVWDGHDLCPNTPNGADVNSDGCPENELDNDNDGYTNDLDDCDDVAGNSTLGSIGCPDADGDGWGDLDDSHPYDNTEWNDTDLDGIGDNSDDCVNQTGNSTKGLLGCVDTDGDGWANSTDAFPYNHTEWKDSDSDGFGDNTDHFPLVSSQWSDFDSDGFGDNLTGLEGDNCPNIAGTSFREGVFGCIDSDGDGWADSIDDLPSNPLQHIDQDGDGVGDSFSSGSFDRCVETPTEEIAMVNSYGCAPSERDSDIDSINDDMDQCPNTDGNAVQWINTTMYLDYDQQTLNPIFGCAPSEIDSDNDGYSDDVDDFVNDPNQWQDSDGDGYGDNMDAEGGDECPNQKGTSLYDKVGCYDTDGDGWSVESDFNDLDPTQWNDTDGDGFGDNWADESWSSGREFGQFVQDATFPDRCPNEYSSFLYAETQGCLTALDSTDEDTDNQQSSGDDSGDSNIGLILGIAGAGIIFTLFGAIAVLLNKKKQPKKKRKSSGPKADGSRETSQEDIVNQTELVEDELSEAKSNEIVEFVSSWEELPDGEWLPNDEDGVNWYQDKEGRYWHSTEDGFKIWQE